MKERLGFLELYVLLVPTEDQDIWNFYGSMTLNNGKQLHILEAFAKPFT